MDRYTQVLQELWGFTDFRYPQREIMDAYSHGDDVLAVLPTGSGKSLCFQLPAHIESGITLVVSPLLALMEEQVNELNQKGISAMFFDRSSEKSIDQQFVECVRGDYKIVYCSPERLSQTSFLNHLAQAPINRIAVDEAHCISSWGHDFRPAYLKISDLRGVFPKCPIIALTATATPQVIGDIETHLKLKQPQRFQNSVIRSNIFIRILKTEDKLRELYHFLAANPSTSIVYAYSRKQTEYLAQQLESLGIKAHFFHAGLAAVEKRSRIQDWKNQTVDVMIATTAFGMGIDFGQVRKVAHWDLPESIENYCQEIGRAGRDGAPAEALLLYKENDLKALKERIIGNWPEEPFLHQCYNKLANYLKIAKGDGLDTSFHLHFEDFCQTYNFSKKKALQALELMERLDFLRIKIQRQDRVYLQLRINSTEIQRRIESQIPGFQILEHLWRHFPEIVRTPKYVPWKLLKKQLQHSQILIQKELDRLVAQRIISEYNQMENMTLHWIYPREDDYIWTPHRQTIRQLEQRKHKQFEDLKNFVQKKQCRTAQILEYFGEKSTERCSHCDGPKCVAPQPADRLKTELYQKIEQLPLGMDQLKMEFPNDLKSLEMNLQKLLEEGYICINAQGQFQKK